MIFVFFIGAALAVIGLIIRESGAETFGNYCFTFGALALLIWVAVTAAG